ncbi:MAG: hypothetical protein IK057_00990 [Clostridia bacterium]|nr:hypothetical protein [Clostridia bacterium]
MGLFFNYNKEGPGVDKDAPKKKGIALYIELFFRKFWLLIRANMLYFAVSLPVIAVYNMIIIAYLPDNDFKLQISLILTAIITVLWGTGPVTGGYVYLLRNFAREEHVWLRSDFFEKSRETFKLGIIVLLCDLAVLVFGINAAIFYSGLMKEGAAVAKYAFVMVIFGFAIYTFMHYYVYELYLTFDNKTGKTLKNALIMSMAMLPANLIFTISIIVLTFLVFGVLAPLFTIVLFLSFWISLMRFPIDFYVARMLKRKFIDTQSSGESGE